MKRLFSVIAFGLATMPFHLNAATSVSQFGITWSFESDHQVGKYANGDWWVVGPVTITDITPRSVNDNGWIKNGTQLNSPISGAQGFDNSMDYMSYKEERNVSPNITGSPLHVETGSLVSSVSKSTKDNRPQLQTAAILTVVAAPPPDGAFRPAPVGSDTTSKWTKYDLDYSVLRKLPVVPEVRSIDYLATKFERPWLELNPNWTGRYIHPEENQPDYGRDMSKLLGDAMLALQFNYSDSKKETLLIRLVQYGLDVYGTAVEGGVWTDLGGHNQGRKMPLLFAGKLLNATEILDYGDAEKHFIFQEDRQTWYVEESDVGRTLYSADGREREKYIESDVGVPEWGEQHTKNQSRDGRNWNVSYRIPVGTSLVSHMATARLLGLEDQWNWPPFFDYMDRFYQLEKVNASGSTNTMSLLDVVLYEGYIAKNKLPTAPSALVVQGP